MSWEDFVDWLRIGLCTVLMIWQAVAIAVVVGVIMVAPLVLIQWIFSMVVGA